MPIIGNFHTSGGSSSGSGGLTLGRVDDLSFYADGGKVYVKWTDPNDLIISGTTLASWAGTALVRKVGTMPTSRNDGVTVVDSKEKNAYADSYFCDDSLADGATYCYKFFSYTAEDAYLEMDGNEFSVTLESVCGVEWDGTSTTILSRTGVSKDFVDPTPAVANGTGSSPFDDMLPWSGMVKSTDSQGGVLVSIPKFYYKMEKTGTKLSLEISSVEKDGFYCSPGHADRGDGKGERDFIYVGRYHSAADYKSTTGVAQQHTITRSTARDSISALGSDIHQWDWAAHWSIKMLYLVEFADWDSQAKIGQGCSESSSKVDNGQTDAMQYHTGTTAAERTTYGYTQYRNIEGLWDNVYDWVDGCYYNASGLNVIMNPSLFSDTTGGTLVGLPTSGYPSAVDISSVAGFEWALYPTTSSGSTSTYIPDSWLYSASFPCLFVGGDYGRSLVRGLFCVNYNSVTVTSASIGCRLMKLP